MGIFDNSSPRDKITQTRNPAQRRNFFSKSDGTYVPSGKGAAVIPTGTVQDRPESLFELPTQEELDKGRAEMPWLVDQAIKSTGVINPILNVAGRDVPPTPPQNTPTELRAGGADRDKQYANALQQADTMSALYNMLNIMDESGMSEDPAYASEIERIKNAANTQLTSIQREIEMLQGGGEILAEQSEIGRERIEGLMADFKPNSANLEEAYKPARAAVAESLDNALAPSPEVALKAGETYGKSGGGATTQAMADKATDKRNEGVREIEAAVSGQLNNFQALGGKINAAAGKVAESQVALFGLQDAGMRERARLEMEIKIRNNTWDLVEQRKGILDAQDDAIATLAAEREAIAAGNVSMVDIGYNAQSNAAIVTDTFFEKALKDTGLSLSPQEKGLAEQLVAEMTNMVPDARDAGWLNMLEANPNLAALPAEKQAALQQVVMGTASTFDRAFKEWENKDYSSVKKLTPGSSDMANLAFTAGTTGQNALPEEYVAELARSAAFHKIIEIQSGGNVNYKGKGSLSGLGGLPASVYAAAGVDPKTATAVEQMQVLMLYIVGAYGGDPTAALQSFIENEEFVKQAAANEPAVPQSQQILPDGFGGE